MSVALATIVSAIVAALAAVLGALITARATSDKVQRSIEIHNAVQDTKLDELTREVREHNNFAQRMPVLEQRFTDQERRLENLEKAVDKFENKNL